MSKNTMKYRGYIAKVEFSVEDKCLHGKIDGIADLVTFEADSASEIEKEFHAAVDDYLAFCAEIGKEPDKHYSGTFNIRIDPSVHRSLEYYATEHNMTLNAVVSEACGCYVKGDTVAEDGWIKPLETQELHPQGWRSDNLGNLQNAA